MNIKPLPIPCVILCGGKSSRMKEDKALLSFENFNSLSEYQYKRLKPYFSDVYLSSKENKFDFDTKVIFDDSDVYSPLIALKSILKKFETSVFILSVDTPFVEYGTIARLYKFSQNVDCVIAEAEKKHFLCGIYSPKIISKIEEILAQDIHKIGFVLKNVETKYINFDNEKEFMNLNTPSDYQDALSYKKNK